MGDKLCVCWISAGVSSFVAGYLTRDIVDEYIYIDIDDQHPDSLRFISDCENVLGRKIKKLQSNYGTVRNAIMAAGCIKIPSTGFAPCTNWLKKRVRKEWEYEHREYEISYVWGMDFDEKDRAHTLVETMFEFTQLPFD